MNSKQDTPPKEPHAPQNQAAKLARYEKALENCQDAMADFENFLNKSIVDIALKRKSFLANVAQTTILTNKVLLEDRPNSKKSDVNGSAAGQPYSLEKEDFGIALFGFTRQQLLENSLKSLSRQGVLDKVHVWIDGDQGNPARRKDVEKTLEIVAQYDVKKVHKHRGNLGFRKVMLHAMSYMCDTYDKIAFLEDDCFPSRDFAKTFAHDLEAIKDRKDIFSVYGSPFNVPAEENGIGRFQGWGWGTTADKLGPVMSELTQCYLLTEEQFLKFTKAAMTPEILKLMDATPGRQPSSTLKAFFAWDEAVCLLTALRGLKHIRTENQTVFNCGAGADSTHFTNLDFYRKPPFNMISPDEVWDHY